MLIAVLRHDEPRYLEAYLQVRTFSIVKDFMLLRNRVWSQEMFNVLRAKRAKLYTSLH